MKEFARIAKVVAGALVVFALLSMVLMAVLFHVFFGRNDLPVANTEWTYADVDQQAYPRREVLFASGNINLKGYVYGEGNSKGLIVVAHGIASGADSHLPETLYFVDHGWTVFAFDGTGTRLSEGEGIRGLVQTRRDVEAALQFVAEDVALENLPLVLYGHSMGGYAVTSCLGEVDNVQAAVCISGFNNPNATMKYYIDSVLPVMGWLEYPFICLQDFFVFGLDSFVTAVDGINQSGIPVLVVYGTEDDVVPPDTIGVPAYQDSIVNNRVEFVCVDEEYRNRHATAWLSKDAACYTLEVENMLAGEEDKAGGVLSVEQAEDIVESIDRNRMKQLDRAFLDNVEAFFERSIDTHTRKAESW